MIDKISIELDKEELDHINKRIIEELRSIDTSSGNYSWLSNLQNRLSGAIKDSEDTKKNNVKFTSHKELRIKEDTNALKERLVNKTIILLNSDLGKCSTEYILALTEIEFIKGVIETLQK